MLDKMAPQSQVQTCGSLLFGSLVYTDFKCSSSIYCDNFQLINTAISFATIKLSHSTLL